MQNELTDYDVRRLQESERRASARLQAMHERRAAERGQSVEEYLSAESEFAKFYASER